MSTAAPAGASSASGSSRRLQQTQNQVDEVVDIMRVNVDKVLERDQKLSELDDRADALQAGASQFETSAAKLKRKYWWKNCKMWAIGIIVVVIIIIIIIGLPYCPGPPRPSPTEREESNEVKKDGNNGNPRRRRACARTSRAFSPRSPSLLPPAPRSCPSRGDRALSARVPPPCDWRLEDPITAALAPAAPSPRGPAPAPGRGRGAGLSRARL
nr:vesicle-associated membrane protein 3 isoform X1 [Equus caballus]